MAPGYFVGRSSELHMIEEILKPGDEPPQQQRVALGGLGGVGKTQLAITYAKRNHSTNKSIFWLSAASEATLRRSLRSMAGQIFPIQEYAALEDEQILIHVRRWLSDAKNSTQWLLVFDSYDDPDQFGTKQYYLPASHGAIIITTRLPVYVQEMTVSVRPIEGYRINAFDLANPVWERRL